MVNAIGQYLLGKVYRDSKGVTSLEYAVLAVGIVLVVAAAAVTLGTNVNAVFGKIDTAL